MPGKRILIYRLGSLGDTVIALPCFHQIRQCFPDAEITLLTNRPIVSKAAPVESVLDANYFFNHILSYPVGTRNLKALVELVRQIRTHKIDTVINLTAARSRMSVHRDYFFFKVAGVRRFIGFPHLTEDFEVRVDPVTGYGEWEAYRLSRRIKSLGLIDLNDNKYWDLRLTEDEYKIADSLLDNLSYSDRFLAISMGTKNQINDWGITNWSILLSRLKNKLKNWKLVTIGAMEDRAAAEKLMGVWDNNGFNLCGQTKPRVSAAVLKKAEIYIGHDSGPMHLAACVGTPCVGIFSSRSIAGQWFPRGNFNKILYHQVECSNCGLEVCIEQGKKCILSITIDEVENAAMHLINTNTFRKHT